MTRWYIDSKGSKQLIAKLNKLIMEYQEQSGESLVHKPVGTSRTSTSVQTKLNCKNHHSTLRNGNKTTESVTTLSNGSLKEML